MTKYDERITELIEEKKAEIETVKKREKTEENYKRFVYLNNVLTGICEARDLILEIDAEIELEVLCEEDYIVNGCEQ